MRALALDDLGSMSLLTILLLPVLFVVTAGVLELGAARLVAARAQIAADLATTIAVNEQDQSELERSGRLRLASDAADVARSHFSMGIEPLARSLAADPAQIATSADVAVFPVANALDPRTGRTYEGPTVRISADVPIRTPAFGALVGRPVTVVRILSSSSAR